MNTALLVQLEHFENLLKEVKEVKSLLLRENPLSEIPELLRTSEVKKILKLKDSSLATLRLNGTLPFIKIGGTIYYMKKDILKLIEENYSGSYEM